MDPLKLQVIGIKKLLLELETNKAADPDGIPAVALKSCADIMACFLHILFSKSLSEHSLHDD